MKSIVSSIAILFLLACGALFAQKTPPKHSDESDDQIIAAVVKHATLAGKGIVFLSVNGHDPSPEILRLLSAWNMRVLPTSRLDPAAVPNGLGMFKDKETGEFGRYFVAEIGKRLKADRIEVAGGWGDPCGTYTVVLQNGSWSVEKYKASDICF